MVKFRSWPGAWVLVLTPISKELRHAGAGRSQTVAGNSLTEPCWLRLCHLCPQPKDSSHATLSFSVISIIMCPPILCHIMPKVRLSVRKSVRFPCRKIHLVSKSRWHWKMHRQMEGPNHPTLNVSPYAQDTSRLQEQGLDCPGAVAGGDTALQGTVTRCQGDLARSYASAQHCNLSASLVYDSEVTDTKGREQQS